MKPKYILGQVVRVYDGDRSIVDVNYNNRAPVLLSDGKWYTERQILGTLYSPVLHDARESKPHVDDWCIIYNQYVNLSRYPYWWTGRSWLRQDGGMVYFPDEVYYYCVLDPVLLILQN